MEELGDPLSPRPQAPCANDLRKPKTLRPQLEEKHGCIKLYDYASSWIFPLEDKRGVQIKVEYWAPKPGRRIDQGFETNKEALLAMPRFQQQLQELRDQRRELQASDPTLNANIHLVCYEWNIVGLKPWIARLVEVEKSTQPAILASTTPTERCSLSPWMLEVYYRIDPDMKQRTPWQVKITISSNTTKRERERAFAISEKFCPVSGRHKLKRPNLSYEEQSFLETQFAKHGVVKSGQRNRVIRAVKQAAQDAGLVIHESHIGEAYRKYLPRHGGSIKTYAPREHDRLQ